MNKILILEQKIFEFNVVIYRIKFDKYNKSYKVVSSFHALNIETCVCFTKDYNKAFMAFKNAINEIIDYEINKYKKLHGYK